MTTYTSVFGNDTIPPTQSSYSSLTLTSDVILYWPELAQSDTVASDIMDVFADTPYSLALPDASQVSVGRSLLINNIGSATITITDITGSPLATLFAGQIKNIYLTDNTTVAGIWRVYTFGTGTSSADATMLEGYGLTVVDGELAQNSMTHTTAGNATITSTDRASTYIFKPNGMVSCNLLAANTAGNGFFINLANQGTGSVIIDPNSSETVDGLSTKSLVPGESTTLICDGTNWVTVGYGRSTQFQFTKLVMDITTGSPFTLTSTQAENKLLKLIGTPTAAVTINLPAIVAIYYIECSYAGAFHTTVTAGSTSIDLIGTDRVIAYCDGINVVFAQTSALPATNIVGGLAGAVVVQTGIGATGFTVAGLAGQLLASAGAGIPQWTAATFSGSTLTVPQYYNVTATYGALQVSGVDVMRFGSDTSGQLTDNLIINGSFDIWQRGTTGLLSNYTADRWLMNSAGNVPSVSKSIGPLALDFCLVATGVAGNTDYYLAQRVESLNSKDVANRTITVSAWVYSSDVRTIRFLVSHANTIDNFSTTTLIGSTSPAAATSWRYMSAQFNVPNTVNGIELAFGFGAVGAGVTVGISKVRFELGSIATPFKNRQIGLELALCQRYYENSYTVGVPPGTANANGAKNTIVYASTTAQGFTFLVPKRATPTILFWSPSGTAGTVWDNTDTNKGVPIATNIGTTGVRYINNSGTGWSVGTGVTFHYSASSEL